MLRRVALVRSDVSEARITSIIRATTIGELGAMLALTNNRSMLRRNTMSVLTRATRRNDPEEDLPYAIQVQGLRCCPYLLFILLCGPNQSMAGTVTLLHTAALSTKHRNIRAWEYRTITSLRGLDGSRVTKLMRQQGISVTNTADGTAAEAVFASLVAVQHLLTLLGRAAAQPVSRRLPAAAARVRDRVK
jgi:hypothetical protein